MTDLLTAPRASSPPAPEPRGPLTGFLLDHLARPPHELPAAPGGDDDPLVGDDAQLALYLCYELHYRGLARVDEGWEWSPSLLRFRAGLETAYLERLLDEVGPPDAGAVLATAATPKRVLRRRHGGEMRRTGLARLR